MSEEERPSHPIIDSLEYDLKFYNDAIKEVANEVLNNNLSEHPVFIAHEVPISIGELILDKQDFDRSWSISAITLEELVEAQVIESDKQDEFKKIYKDPKQYICIFLISEKGGNFVFFPYQDSSASTGDETIE